MQSAFHFGRAAAIFGLLAVLSLPLAGLSEAEDELRCATLLAFVQNAHWQSPLTANASIAVGVLGRKSLLRWARAGLEGKVVDSRPLRIVEVTAPIDPHCCQVLYFATDRPGDFSPVLPSLYSAHVLTVGESDTFLEQGGAVNLFLQDGHMAFEVSMAALDRSGIEISSKLLRFGQIRDLAKGRRK